MFVAADRKLVYIGEDESLVALDTHTAASENIIHSGHMVSNNARDKDQITLQIFFTRRICLCLEFLSIFPVFDDSFLNNSSMNLIYLYLISCMTALQ